MNERPSPFRQAAGDIEKQIKKVQSIFDTMMMLANQSHISDAYESAFDLEAECEKLTLLARLLPQYTGHPLSVQQMERNIMQSVPISMRFTDEGWFVLSIPALLPKKEHGSPEYVRGFLYPAMKHFFDDRPRMHYPNSVIIFRHIYDRARPKRQYRDHDNIELNAVVDLIALFLLDGDMPLRCFHFYCSAAGDSDSTEITVLPLADFMDWLVGENILKNGEAPDLEKPP